MPPRTTTEKRGYGGLELQRDVDGVGEDADLVQILPRDERAGDRRGGRADVQDHRLATADETRRGTADVRLLGRLGSPHLLERALARPCSRGHGPAADAHHATVPGERVEVAAHRHIGDAEHLSELGDPEELALVQRREHALPSNLPRHQRGNVRAIRLQVLCLHCAPIRACLDCL